MSARTLRPLIRSAIALRASIPARQVVPVLRAASTPLSRNFSSSIPRFGSGEGDSALSAALASEHAYEVEAAGENPQDPDFLQSVKEQGVWQIQDVKGSDSVTLTRRFGNESIKLVFQISDLDDPSEVNEADEDGMPAEEAEDINTPPYIACSLTITKSGSNSAMAIDLEAGEEGFVITNVAMLEKDLASKDGAEGDWARRSKYMGPQIEHLDPTVQDALDNFISERGINESLANFVLQYCEHKEQKDYVSWLKEVKTFIDA